MFSSPDILFDKDIFGTNHGGTLVDQLNYFAWLGYENLHISYALSIVVLVAVASGYYPRYTGLLHWLVAFSFNNSCTAVDGGDQIATILTLYLIPLTLLDNRKNHFHAPLDRQFWQKSLSVFLTRFVIPLQMAFIYFHAGVDKLYKVDEWLNGTAMYYIVQDPLFGFPYEWLTSDFILTSVTWGPVLLEIILFGAIFMTYQKRKYLLVPGLFFHFAIIILFGLVSFFCSMAAGLIIYLLDPAKPIDYTAWKMRFKRRNTVLETAG